MHGPAFTRFLFLENFYVWTDAAAISGAITSPFALLGSRRANVMAKPFLGTVQNAPQNSFGQLGPDFEIRLTLWTAGRYGLALPQKTSLISEIYTKHLTARRSKEMTFLPNVNYILSDLPSKPVCPAEKAARKTDWFICIMILSHPISLGFKTNTATGANCFTEKRKGSMNFADTLPDSLKKKISKTKQKCSD